VLEGLQRLVDLQRLDDELTAFEEERAGLPTRRSALAEQRASDEERLAAAKLALETAESDQRRAEGELQDREALLERLESQQFQVKSNEAYTALLHEMEQAKQAISDSETRILEDMDAIEGARTTLQSVGGGIQESLARIEAEERSLDAREQELTAGIARLREQREELTGQLDAKLLEQYARIAARRKPAVVLIDKELCIGCRVDIPPQTYIEILRSSGIQTCGTCHRILIHATKL
jgi:predicted  nucleic acid-binding Zn-ribbon protein